ncbi:phytoene/squalene synthase family protein [Conexibacter sp. SYSU D00693]|uniref:phytoene/squalene synthase family protein n=1 Tax=Conexibacter sp. SYSU D00693 TaxID=2812560 RepID=UPI00196AFEA5|nr:phytoene/squalene synthase family protein [Conexibacter sp. SYSU D00693]
MAEARATTARVARTFSLACRLLPREVRDDVHLLYLVLRTLDDLVDFGDPRAAAEVEAVEAWCATGAVRSREAAILAALDRRHGLPREAVEDFCRGMRDDLAARPIATEEELDVYCHRVAGTVGLLMAAVLGVVPGREREAARAAAALGCAMQRTNILRDIDEDREQGRVYLAQETLARFGGDALPGHREALVRDQITRADALYDEGLAGVALLARGRFAIRAAGAMYREILRQIERDGYGARPGRAVVPTRRKLAVAARARVAA